MQKYAKASALGAVREPALLLQNCCHTIVDELRKLSAVEVVEAMTATQHTDEGVPQYNR